MPEILWLALGGITYLMCKHMLADYVWQTPYMFRNKGRYGHPGGLVHAGLHVVMTLPLFLFLPPATRNLAIAILAGEFVAHYHIDWVKEKLTERYNLVPTMPRFWNLHGADQLMHGLTYVVIIAALFWGS